MAFFTDDGAVILGLSVAESLDAARRLLEEMQVFLGSSDGACWFESPAPTSSVTFLLDRERVEFGTCRIGA